MGTYTLAGNSTFIEKSAINLNFMRKILIAFSSLKLILKCNKNSWLDTLLIILIGIIIISFALYAVPVLV